MSLAETTELAVKASRRPAGKISGGGNTRQRAQQVQIGAKGDGEEMQDVAGGAVVEDEVYYWEQRTKLWWWKRKRRKFWI